MRANVTKEKETTGKKKRGSWSEDMMAAAVAAVKSKRMGFNEAVKHYEVPRATLKRHIDGTNRYAKDGVKSFGRACDLPPDIEDDLAKHILSMEERFYGLTRSTLLTLAYQIAEVNGISTRFNQASKKAGKLWLKGFLRRHPNITYRQPEATSLARAAGFNRVRVEQFYTLLENVVDENKLTAQHIFNIDETGFTAVQKPQKIYAKKGKHQVGAITSGEKARNVTFVCCASASGQYVPPLVIFPRKRMKADLKEGAPAGSIFACQKNGWINVELFRQWFEHFITVVKPSLQQKVLLILDGHVSHTQSIDVLMRAREAGVILLSLPPHTTHRLQPLDVTFFKPLSTYYNQAVDTWMRAHPGLGVAEHRVCRFFATAYGKAASIATAVNGFQTTGIWPVDRHVIHDSEFAPAAVTEQPNLPPSYIGGQTLPSLPNLPPSDVGGQTLPPLPNLPPSDVGEQTQRVGVESISPLPVRAPLVDGKRRRSSMGATILTDSPYKNTLTQKIEAKQALEAKKEIKRQLNLSKSTAKRPLNPSGKKQTMRQDKRPLSKTLPKAPCKRAKKDIVLDKQTAHCSRNKNEVVSFANTSGAPPTINFYCGGCGELYEESKQDWLRCRKCLEWWEIECAGMLGKPRHLQEQFICTECED